MYYDTYYSFLGLTMPNFKKLNKQPLKLVLAEVLFSPVLGMEKYIPELQDKLRKEYPLSNVRQEQAVNINNGIVKTDLINRWIFSSKNNSTSVDVSINRLVFMTTDYNRFEDFSERISRVIDILIQTVEPSLYTRIGLRYSDVVIPSENEELSELVSENTLLPKCISKIGENINHRTETMVKTNEGNLVFRSAHYLSNRTVIENVMSLPLKFEIDPQPSLRLFLDFDHFWQNDESPEDFDKDSLLKKLNDLHGPTRQMFWNVTTDYARDVKWS